MADLVLEERRVQIKAKESCTKAHEMPIETGPLEAGSSTDHKNITTSGEIRTLKEENSEFKKKLNP